MNAKHTVLGGRAQRDRVAAKGLGIDIDSDRPAAFGAADKTLLEAVASELAARMSVRSR